jgi:N5-(carboxyethyl)ornithine synthase
MQIGVIGTSRKENEKRVAIHPGHLEMIPPDLRRHLWFEEGYGLPFGVSDARLQKDTGNAPLPRAALFERCGALLLLKPTPEDFRQMRQGAVVWGWIHSVQQRDITQMAIEKKMTLVAFEHMNHQGRQSRTHIFQKNNELAGYCGVQHALSLRGIDGHYGPDRKAVVLGFGSVSRGAVCALQNHGIRDITALTRRPPHLIAHQTPGLRYRRYFPGGDGRLLLEEAPGQAAPLLQLLTRADILVNGVLQSPAHPVTFIQEADVPLFRRECLIIDISCDQGMGFHFAHPTSFAQPLFQVGRLLYYSVDHTPSLLWDSASWEISAALLPFLKDFITGGDNPVLKAAVDMERGVILNREVLAFQRRAAAYPHPAGKAPRGRHILSQNAGVAGEK